MVTWRCVGITVLVLQSTSLRSLCQETGFMIFLRLFHVCQNCAGEQLRAWRGRVGHPQRRSSFGISEDCFSVWHHRPEGHAQETEEDEERGEEKWRCVETSWKADLTLRKNAYTSMNIVRLTSLKLSFSQEVGSCLPSDKGTQDKTGHRGRQSRCWREMAEERTRDSSNWKVRNERGDGNYSPKPH